ncbi:MAG: 30S ribosomal protein S17 [Chloroflexota bacterium]
MNIKRKTMTGSVVSHKMDKTAVVVIERLRHHPLYHKTVRKAAKYKVHDEKNECQVGDVVKMIEARPFSKDKNWKVVEIVSRREVVSVTPQEIQ